MHLFTYIEKELHYTGNSLFAPKIGRLQRISGSKRDMMPKEREDALKEKCLYE